MDARPSPVNESQRIAALDTLRGFALLGILCMNIISFAMPMAAYFDPTAYGDFTGINLYLWGLTHVLADMKFMAIFAMLFGAGILLMAERAESSGQSVSGLHYRRMGWLVIFGLLHAHLLWYGDVLFWYGMAGLLVFKLRKQSPGKLITVGVILLTIASAIMLLGGISAQYWPPEVMAESMAQYKPSATVKAAEVATYQSGWLEQMGHRSAKALEAQTGTLLIWALWRASGLMLIGMALFKLGVFKAERSQTFYLRLMLLGAFLGLALIVPGIRYNFAIGWAAPDYFLFGQQFNYWGSILIALSWTSLIMLLCQAQVSGLLAGLRKRLAAVGRMAFTNYIMQTLICTTIFYGHGFGLFGQLERSSLVLVVLGVWAVQLVLSPIWLRHFRFGPMEWVWRSLVYRQAQPMRREVQGTPQLDH